MDPPAGPIGIPKAMDRSESYLGQSTAAGFLVAASEGETRPRLPWSGECGQFVVLPSAAAAESRRAWAALAGALAEPFERLAVPGNRTTAAEPADATSGSPCSPC